MLAAVSPGISQQSGNSSDAPNGAEEDASASAEAWLSGRLTSLLGSKVRNGMWGAMVVSLTNGDTLFAHNPGLSLNPASTLKLYTTALAFERLGPDYRFRTDVFRDGAVSHGTLLGNLILRGGDDGVIQVRGWIGSISQPRVYILVVPEPAQFATGAFLRALRDVGVVVEGKARIGGTPAGAVRVTTMPSPPLYELAGTMNRESINHFAELIFRNAARDADPQGVGSASMGNALLKDFLELRVGASAKDVFAADGSGLSTLDRVTARSMVQLLSYADHAPWSRQFHESLPVAGREETLRLRMRKTPAQDNLHAKTGTTNEVVALSGYVAAKTGEVLAFSFLYNGKDRWNARATIDAMGVTLADFVRDDNP